MLTLWFCFGADEVIALMGLLDRLYYCVRRASTDIWLMRMLLTCRQQNA